MTNTNVGREGTAAGLVWEEPKNASGAGPNKRWLEVAAALRSRPGTWARVADDSTAQTAQNIKRGKILAFADGVFEAKTTGVKGKPGRVAIYARYIGPKAVS